MTGSIATASWLGFKLRWIKEHQPDIYKKSWKFLTASAYINFRLTGNICIDYSEASGSYLMDQTCQWNSWLATQVGVDIEKLPEIRNSWEVLGGITEAAASATGLTPGDSRGCRRRRYGLCSACRWKPIPRRLCGNNGYFFWCGSFLPTSRVESICHQSASCCRRLACFR